MKKWGVFAVIILIMVIMVQHSDGMRFAVEDDRISGEIIYSATNQGISDLVVKLTPPRHLNKSPKIFITGRSGEFWFTGLKKGKYLLEVYQGPTLLYRNVIDMNKETEKTIMLHGQERRFEPNIPLKKIPREFKYE